MSIDCTATVTTNNTFAAMSTIPNAAYALLCSLVISTFKRRATYMLAKIIPFPQRYRLMSTLELNGDIDSETNKSTAATSNTTAICVTLFGGTNEAVAVRAIRRPHSTTS